MACEYCRRTNGHPSSCPNYVPNQSNYICNKCGENILIGEKYIENDNNQYAHLECVDDIEVLVDFLGYEIKEMEDDWY